MTNIDTRHNLSCMDSAKKINAIDKSTVHRICSGQVVLTLATAVKELVENSLDSGATLIETRLKEYGASSIEVIDNGCGIEESQFDGITLKHHTSKLREFEDLVNVSTYGFRGEALSSLCALSDLTLFTRCTSAEIGTKLSYDHNGIITEKHSHPRQVLKLVNEIYHQYNRLQYPFIALCINLKNDCVDVNVTPDKRQILINNEKYLFASIKASLHYLFKEAYGKIDLQMENQSLVSAYLKSPGASNSFQSDEEKKTPLSSLSAKFSRSTTYVVNSSPKICKSCLTDSSSTKRSLQFSPFANNLKQRKLGQSCGSNSHEELPNEFNCAKLLLEKSVDTISIAECNIMLSKCINDASTTESDVPGMRCDVADEIPNMSEISSSVKVSELEYFVDVSNPTLNKKEISASLEKSESDYLDSCIVTPICAKRKEIDGVASNFLRNFKIKVNNSNEDLEEISCKPKIKLDEAEIIYIDDSDEHIDLTRRRSVSINTSLEYIAKINKKFPEGEKDARRRFSAKIAPSDNAQAENELRKEISKDMFKEMKVHGQFNLGFIVASLGSDLFIIDQHATDEKYNFEILEKTCILQNQPLIKPLQLELTPVNESVVLDSMDIFVKNGFEFKFIPEVLPGRRLSLLTMPHSRGWEFGASDIDEMIFLLADSPNVLIRPSRIRAMLASRACRKSIMIGTALNLSQMKKLVIHMADMEQPWNCPHGRPTIRHLLNLDLLVDLNSEEI